MTDVCGGTMDATDRRAGMGIARRKLEGTLRWNRRGSERRHRRNKGSILARRQNGKPVAGHYIC